MTAAAWRGGRAFFGAVAVILASLIALVATSCGHEGAAPPPPIRAQTASSVPPSPPPLPAPPRTPAPPPSRTIGVESPAPVEPAAAVSAVASSPELRPGAIQMIQQRLESLGTLPAQKGSGELDAATHAALARFQEANHLPATGEPDGETVRMLGLRPSNIFEPAPGSSE